MEFTWKVEDQKLRKEVEAARAAGMMNFLRWTSDYVFEIEKQLTREEKLAYMDKVGKGALSAALQLAEKFEKEKDTIKRTSWGNLNQGSLKAWFRRNTKGTPLKISEYCDLEVNGLYARRQATSLLKQSAYDTHADLIDEEFHRYLWIKESEEVRWYKAHDEYAILVNKLSGSRLMDMLGIPYWHGTSGMGRGEYQPHDKSANKPFTLEELQFLDKACQELKDVIEEFGKKKKEEFDKL